MKTTRRDFFKKSLAGTLPLGTAALPQPLAVITRLFRVEKPTAWTGEAPDCLFKQAP